MIGAADILTSTQSTFAAAAARVSEPKSSVAVSSASAKAWKPASW